MGCPWANIFRLSAYAEEVSRLQFFFDTGELEGDGDGKGCHYEGVDELGDDDRTAFGQKRLDEVIYDGLDGGVPGQGGDQTEGRGRNSEHLGDDFQLHFPHIYRRITVLLSPSGFGGTGTTYVRSQVYNKHPIF